MTRIFRFATLILFACGASLLAQDKGVTGYWKEPGGSVIHIEACGAQICAALVEISSSAPSRIDGRNPDHALRQRTLCGLRIGQGFHAASEDKAEGGTLYDPKSGRTYHGIMTRHGDALDLRGYVGISLFGRTERWTHTPATLTCRK